jgi:hypothetical protein
MAGRKLILSMALIGITGCASTSGVITGTSGAASHVGTIAPDVEYKSMEGKQASFNEVRAPIAVVVFVAPQGTSCCSLEPRVVNLANQLWDLPVTVAQFSEPTSKCPHGPGCVEVCNLRKNGIMSLCDAQRLAWKAYGKPAPGTLILIGSDNKTVATGSLSNPGPIVDQAKRLGQKEKKSVPGENRKDIY